MCVCVCGCEKSSQAKSIPYENIYLLELYIDIIWLLIYSLSHMCTVHLFYELWKTNISRFSSGLFRFWRCVEYVELTVSTTADLSPQPDVTFAKSETSVSPQASCNNIVFVIFVSPSKFSQYDFRHFHLNAKRIIFVKIRFLDDIILLKVYFTLLQYKLHISLSSNVGYFETFVCIYYNVHVIVKNTDRKLSICSDSVTVE